jgi:hypothetical protein
MDFSNLSPSTATSSLTNRSPGVLMAKQKVVRLPRGDGAWAGSLVQRQREIDHPRVELSHEPGLAGEQVHDV